MKTIILNSLFILIFSTAVTAQINPPMVQPAPKPVASDEDDQFAKELAASGKHQNSIITWMGYNKHLYTYTDKRWVDSDDQGDYIDSAAFTGGFELVYSDFSDYDPVLNDMRAGININFYYHDSIKPRTLYAVASPGPVLDEQTFPDPASPLAKEWKAWLYPGAFIGVDKKWYAVDLGLTLELWAYNESVRKRYNTSGVIVEDDGRGILWGDPGFNLNFYFRLGREDKGYFDMAFYRLDYNSEYGTLMYRIVLPVSQYFKMKVGGYLYSASAVFLEPTVTLPGMEVALRLGTIINYNDEHLKKIAITESMISSISFMYKWQ
jgi:hypothetical protein